MLCVGRLGCIHAAQRDTHHSRACCRGMLELGRFTGQAAAAAAAALPLSLRLGVPTPDTVQELARGCAICTVLSGWMLLVLSSLLYPSDDDCVRTLAGAGVASLPQSLPCRRPRSNV